MSTATQSMVGSRTGDDVVAGNVYDKYHTSNPVARRLMDGFLQSFDALLQLEQADTLLEVGCGEGHLIERIQRGYPERRIAGFDISYGIIQQAMRNVRGAAFLQGTADQMPWPDASWDVVVVCEVLEHLPEPEKALLELQRVTRKGCLLSVPREPIWRMANMARGKYWASLGNTPGHIQHWNTDGFIALVSQRFDVKQVRSPFPWTMVWAEVKG